MKLSTLAALAGLSMVGVLATPLTADPLSCHCETDTDFWRHKFCSNCVLEYACGSGQEYGCHGVWATGGCSSAHAGCGPEGPVSFDVESALKNQMARYAMATRYDVVYNADRQALQVVGCGGGLIAHIPVATEHVAFVLAAISARHV